MAEAGDGEPGQAGPGLPGARLLELVAVMDRLRTECPWDAKQTHATLAPYLLEESYEAVDALESGDQEALCEELGDVLLQVAFHARVAAERTDGTGWTIDDVAGGIVDKLIRRHPHVFGDVSVSGADEVTQNWDDDQGGRARIPRRLAALRVRRRAARPACPVAGRAAAAAGGAGRPAG